MSFASNMLSVARRLIRKYGQSILFNRVVEGDFVPSTGAVGVGTSSSYTAFGCLIAGPEIELPNTLTDQDDSDMWVEVNAASSVPLIGDTCILQNRVYRVLEVTAYITQSVTVVYKLTVRI